MRAYYLDNAEPISAERLLENGVLFWCLPLDGYQAVLDDLRTSRGYVTQDEVTLRPDTHGLEAALAKFDPEHLHEDDEVRFLLDGEGIFDIRSNSDRWMRVEVEAGDLIIVPKGKHHRFELSAKKSICCIRLFKDPAGWAPVYRSPTTTSSDSQKRVR